MFKNTFLRLKSTGTPTHRQKCKEHSFPRKQWEEHSLFPQSAVLGTLPTQAAGQGTLSNSQQGKEHSLGSRVKNTLTRQQGKEHLCRQQGKEHSLYAAGLGTLSPQAAGSGILSPRALV